MATLGTTTLDYGATGARAHPGAETVLALAATNIGLIGAFHNKRIQVGEFGVGARLRSHRRDCQRGARHFRLPHDPNRTQSRKIRLPRERKNCGHPGIPSEQTTGQPYQLNL